MKIKIRKEIENIHLPKRAHYNDAGADVFAIEDVILEPNKVTVVDTGLTVEIPDGYMGCIFPKSGLTSKGIIAQLPPIDSGYRGTIHAIVYNSTNENYQINAGDKIGQLVIMQVILAEFVENLSNDRGEGAFGSTGV